MQYVFYNLEHVIIFSQTEFGTKSIADILEAIRNTPGLFGLSQLYGVLLNKAGPNYEFKDKTGMILLVNQ